MMNGVAAAAAEEVGESSSPARVHGAAACGPAGVGTHDVVEEIYRWLVESGIAAASDLEFRNQLDAHFARLPPSYRIDVNVEKAEDIILHQKILVDAKDPDRRPVFHVRFIKFEESQDAKHIEDDKDEDDLSDASSAGQTPTLVPLHEVIFSTIDKPKLLSQLSALLSDVGLNIREAHVFSTIDGYSLDVFVVDGWPEEDTDELQKELELAIERNEANLTSSSSTHSSITERMLAAQPKIGDCEIDKRLLKMGEKIASGSCCDLFRGNYLGQDVAIKILKSEHVTEALGIEFAQEVVILSEVQHRNIVRFVGACTKSPQFAIITEYMPGGNLYDFLHKHHNILQLPLVLKFALDICKGMEYLHQNNIIHRDLKTANLLMDENHVVKVADFGVARFQNQGGVMTAETGTYRWMAPEVISHQPYDQKADVYSFAIVLWELVTSKIPYGTMTPLQAALGVRQGLRPELPVETHPRLLGLMQRCWETVPAHRPSFSEVIVELKQLLDQVKGTSDATSQTGLENDPDIHLANATLLCE